MRHQSPTCVATIALALSFGRVSATMAQDAQKEKPPEDVIRVYTDIVQTDVMVFDKQGHFVNGLTRNDFDLRVDGKSRAIEFFEKINAGSAGEEAQLAAARGMQTSVGRTPALDLDRGRTILFYIDDLHLAPGDLVYLRKNLSKFIDEEMGQNDEMVITSASGQIGFLQQLTDNHTVLHAAIDRLKAIPYSIRDPGHPPMTEYHALLIDRRPATTPGMPIRDVFEYFVGQEMEQTNSPYEQAEQAVRSRARTILQQGEFVTKRTVDGLKSLIQSSRELPGRKLLFFVSGGFFYDDRNADTRDELQSISADAARNGVVIYALDARGLVTGAPPPGEAGAIDPTGILDREARNELWASRQPMTTLALETGGRTIFDTNAPEKGLDDALKETSVYYLLAWRADHEEPGQRKAHHVDISLMNRRDATVRLRQNYSAATNEVVKPSSSKPDAAIQPPAAKLTEAIMRASSSRDLAVGLDLQYANTGGKEPALTITLEVKIDGLSFATEGGKKQALVDLAGFVYNTQGKAGSSFQQQVTVTPVAGEEPRLPGQGVVYKHRVALAPGLYQVRVGARDEKSGKIGSANEWIEIPDLNAHKLAVSTITLREALSPPNAPGANAAAPRLLVDHRLQRDSALRLDGQIYNSARASDSKSDVVVQIQILRDRQPVVTTPLQRVPDNQSSSTLGFGGTLSLKGMPAGRYLLLVTAIDRTSKASASQKARFEIN